MTGWNTHLGRFFALAVLLCIVYALWLIAFWPAILGQDSLAILLEVDTQREFQAGKPAFWYLYILASYGPWKLVEIPAALQLLLCAIICSNILSWLLEWSMKKSFWYCLLGVALAPSVIYYNASLYSDGIYAIATAGMLFEAWRSYRSHKLDKSGLLILAITTPFALFSRPNGLLNILPLLAFPFFLPRRELAKAAAVVLPWVFLASAAGHAFTYRTPIGSVFPLALYETVGFLESRPMGLWERNEPRITEDTALALTKSGSSLEHISQYYDHYYWDPLIFRPDGPALLQLPREAKKTIIREFFAYNVWHNFPAFAASRVNIFLYSAFADGDLPGPTNAENILPMTESRSTARFRHGALHRSLVAFHEFTIKYRVIFWTPWAGLLLVVLGCRKTWRERDRAGFIICLTFAVQLAAVFTFSIAGEYRYLLGFFTAPLVLLPVLYHPHPSSKA